MADQDKTRQELLDELGRLRLRLARLEVQNKRLEIAEMDLAESQHRLQEILDNATAVIYVKDLDGRYFTINRRYEELFHVSRDGILGETDYKIFPEAIADAFRANDRRVLEAGAPLEFEEIATHADGEHIYLSLKFPLRDTSGHIYAICGISSDITERKRMEEQLKEALTRLQRRISGTSAGPAQEGETTAAS